MTTIKLHNTKTRRKEVFLPLKPDDVRMYVCGPTVYDRAHLGNARPVVVFDLLYRLLRHVYGADHVTYVRNFTDVDDKINAKAAETGRSITDITDETIRWYLDDMGALAALEPDHMPRATAYIAQMVTMIESLIEKGYAYAKPISYGHNSQVIYFDSKKAPEHSFFKVQSFDRYGTLSGRSLDEMISGARAEVGEGKENPMDFVLWKPSTVDEPGWPSPWGFGRPGWHIECSAMAKALLGDVFDIHGGGIDLQFPHHENEIAQSCCANGTDKMAQVWMHNEMLLVEGKKMSKSLGNFFTVRDLLDQGVPGEVIRYVFLMTHYRKPMDWTEKKRREAEKNIREWKSILQIWAEDMDSNGLRTKANYAPSNEVISAIADDLNTALALKSVKDRAKRAKEIPEIFGAQLYHDLKFLGFLDGDWWMESLTTGDVLSSLGAKLKNLWTAAKESKDFSEVDRLKSALVAAGIEVRMSKDAVALVPGPDFDPAKLEGL